MINSIKIAALEFLYTDADVNKEREDLIASINKVPSTNKSSQKQLLVDVSVIIKADVSTGIQRVVRAFLQQLINNPPIAYIVRPVFANASQGYNYAPDDFILGQNARLSKLSSIGKQISISPGDVFFGLDLCTNVLPRHMQQLKEWKKAGLKIHFLVYDLLPVLNPEWFNIKMTRNFFIWLRAVAILADSAICISKPVKNDLRAWLVRKYNFSRNTLPVSVVELGFDLSSSVPSKGLPDNASQLLYKFSENPTALMVGTLEPRKGHQDVLEAFEALWQKDKNINLVFVGNAGWKSTAIQKRLLNHEYLDSRVFWLRNVSDEFLDLIYMKTKGLIIASKGEGFGLPLIEALGHGKPVLCRDLAVFKFYENAAVTFFDETPAKSLKGLLFDWLDKEQQFDAKQIKIKDWREATLQLCKHLNIN